MDIPAERGPPRTLDLESELKPSRDFRITDSVRIGQGSIHAKARDNIAAIRTLKAIEARGGEATEDEKVILARYAGWGAMAGAFESNYRRREEWDKTAEDLKQLLTDEEYGAARASTPNAHFTSPTVIARHVGSDAAHGNSAQARPFLSRQWASAISWECSPVSTGNG